MAEEEEEERERQQRQRQQQQPPPQQQAQAAVRRGVTNQGLVMMAAMLVFVIFPLYEYWVLGYARAAPNADL